MHQHYNIKLSSIILLYVISCVYVQLVREMYFFIVSFVNLQSVGWAPSCQNILYTNIYITIVTTTWFQYVCCEFYLTFSVISQNVYYHYFYQFFDINLENRACDLFRRFLIFWYCIVLSALHQKQTSLVFPGYFSGGTYFFFRLSNRRYSFRLDF